MNSNRLVYIDVAKCFAIFLVVWGHVIQNYGESSLINKTINEYFILTFHMPLFAIISGMFYKNTITWRKIIVEKGKQLILPQECSFWENLITISFANEKLFFRYSF